MDVIRAGVQIKFYGSENYADIVQVWIGIMCCRIR